VGYSLQYHADQSLDDLVEFWAALLGSLRTGSSWKGSRTAMGERPGLALGTTAF
jgi:hypothetical protein